MVLFRAGDIVWHLTTPFAWPAILHKKQASAAFYKFTYFEDGQTWEQVKHPVDELKPFWESLGSHTAARSKSGKSNNFTYTCDTPPKST